MATSLSGYYQSPELCLAKCLDMIIALQKLYTIEGAIKSQYGL